MFPRIFFELTINKQRLA